MGADRSQTAEIFIQRMTLSTLYASRPALDRGIEAIHTDLLRLGDIVDRAIDRSIEALSVYDPHLAQAVIDEDQVINRKRYAIEENCLNLIATQQPMARDLRGIIADMHVAGELERMADHARGIAVITRQLAGAPTLPALTTLQRMAQATRQMLRSSLNAFVLGNVEQAERNCQLDDVIDDYHQQVVRTLLTYMLENRSVIGEATYLIWVSHNLERIGDRCVNLNQRTPAKNDPAPIDRPV